VRGHLLPPHLPGHRTPAQEFDDLVLDAVDRLAGRWADELAGVDVVVEEVPSTDPPVWSDGLETGRAEPARPGRRARIVVHRRTLVERSDDDLARAVHVTVVEQLAALLGRTPEEIDPDVDWDTG
jgi:predicted Zn-dependent protease with MMP-like domain